MKTTNVVIAGLGGQGVLKASDILAQTAFLAGRDVKKAEVHGMSQRGGSVTTDIRFGEHILSPMVPTGEAEYLVVLEPTQVEPSRHCLSPDGKLLNCTAIDSAALPNAKALNVAMLGMLSAYLDIPEEHWKAAIHASLPAKLHAVNDEAFAMGKAAAN